MPRAAKPKEPRRRLDAEAARALILDAAEKRLALVGPSGIRLQEVAADAGLSHPSVLHHFGSREQLVKAVIARSVNAIDMALIETIRESEGDEQQLETLLESVATTLDRTGHARVIFWLVLEGHGFDRPDSKLSDIVDAAHALRVSRTAHAKKPKREDTARTIVLATLALVAGNILGPTLLENAGLESDVRDTTRFRRWLAHVLLSHLDGPGA